MGQILRVMSGLAVRAAFDSAIVPAFEKEAGCEVVTGWTPTTLIMQRVPAGDTADVLVVTKSAMDKLADGGFVVRDSRIELVHSRVGLAVPGGAPHPDIGTLDAFRAALLGARSVAYSRAGASGIHFEKVLEELGIAEEVRGRATVIPEGFTAEKLVSGEADLAVQQVSELLVVPGIDIVGRFPEAVQTVTSFSAATTPSASDPSLAARFMAFLHSPLAAEAYRKTGVDPAF